VGERTIESLYEEVRANVPVSDDDRPAEVRPVAPGIRVLALRTPTLPPAAHTNVYLLRSLVEPTGPVAVVDPGSPYGDQQQLLEAAVAEHGVSLILLTHHHGDHVGGAMALADRFGIPIAAHATTARRLARRGVTVTQTIEDGEVVCGATAIFTPGHADGHLCFELGGAIIAGDMVAGLGTILIDPDEGDMALYLASLAKLRARPQATLLPAHGPAIPDGHAKLTEYLGHRQMREDRVVAALEAATASSLTDLVERAYSDTPRVLWKLAERSLLAHLVKLVREGKAREVDDGRWCKTTPTPL